MNDSLATHYLADAISTFRDYKKLADKALAQVRDEEFFSQLDEESNSIAIIIKHIAGNMISRWTDFLTSDGEKPDRHRDMEFVIAPETTRDEVIAHWKKGWASLFAALEPLKPEDFDRMVMIRGEAHSLIQAINRQLTHYAYHIGQIVFLAKHCRSSAWNSLSIPRNRSGEFNTYLTGKASKNSDRKSRFDASEEFVRNGSEQP
ncbi:MAG: hypothetical protein QOJ64_2325 [Acidobacteriota bacterium]|jgi:hypothetical protein|nr:hypothetical protein [Acidobacteriota bacterium]